MVQLNKDMVSSMFIKGDTVVISMTGEKAIYLGRIVGTNIVRLQLIVTDEVVDVLKTEIESYILSEAV